jgi:hypothetical protein
VVEVSGNYTDECGDEVGHTGFQIRNVRFTAPSRQVTWLPLAMTTLPVRTSSIMLYL